MLRILKIYTYKILGFGLVIRCSYNLINTIVSLPTALAEIISLEPLSLIFLLFIVIFNIIFNIFLIRLGRSLIRQSRKIQKNRDRSKSQLEVYDCTYCNYSYDPLVGDIDRGIQPYTSFQDLEDDWFCPVCEAPKRSFRKD